VIGLQAVQDPIALTTLDDQLGMLQDRKMPRDGRTGNGETTGDFPGGEFAVFQLLKNLPPSRVRQRPEDRGDMFHNIYLAK
jgi:hypothetical protein